MRTTTLCTQQPKTHNLELSLEHLKRSFSKPSFLSSIVSGRVASIFCYNQGSCFQPFCRNLEISVICWKSRLVKFDHSPQVGLEPAKLIVIYHTMDPSSAACASNFPTFLLHGLRLCSTYLNSWGFRSLWRGCVHSAGKPTLCSMINHLENHIAIFSCQNAFF